MPTTVHSQFVAWFRSAAPYFNAFRGKTFVIAFGGEVVADGKFAVPTQDINLLRRRAHRSSWRRNRWRCSFRPPQCALGGIMQLIEPLEADGASSRSSTTT